MNEVCDFCKSRKAVFYIEQVAKDGRTTIHVCAECAQERGLGTDFDSDSSREALKTILDDMSRLAEKPEAAQGACCPSCGCGFSEIERTGQVGCADCYSAFSAEIVKLMKSHGIRGPYTGSLPRRIAGFRSRLTDRLDIRTKLEESLRREDYEKAAVYRDFLKALDANSVAAAAGFDETTKTDKDK